jgi:hypothetical protein
MTFTRDSVLWWLAIAGSLITYLLSTSAPPTQWSYWQWLNFAAAVVATIAGKLAVSPLPSKREVRAEEAADATVVRRYLPVGLLVLLIGASACATTGPRHIATVTAVAAHAALSAVQDTEMALACGKPDAPAPPACVAEDQHKAISAKLAEAFAWDITAATTIRDWPATGAAPTGLGTLLGQITSTINYVLDHLPAGTLKSKLVARLGGGQ